MVMAKSLRRPIQRPFRKGLGDLGSIIPDLSKYFDNEDIAWNDTSWESELDGSAGQLPSQELGSALVGVPPAKGEDFDYQGLLTGAGAFASGIGAGIGSAIYGLRAGSGGSGGFAQVPAATYPQVTSTLSEAIVNQNLQNMQNLAMQNKILANAAAGKSNISGVGSGGDSGNTAATQSKSAFEKYMPLVAVGVGASLLGGALILILKK